MSQFKSSSALSLLYDRTLTSVQREKKKDSRTQSLAKGASPGKALPCCSSWDEVTGEHLFWKELQIGGRQGREPPITCALVRTNIFLVNPPSKTEQLCL